MPTPGVTTLGAVRASAADRADMPTPSTTTFIPTSTWNAYINASYQELYGLLVQKFGNDYFVQTPYTFNTDGVNYLFALPSDFFKLLGVDLKVGNQWATLKPFTFAERNRFSFSNGIPTSGQQIQLWYVPRLTAVSNDSDTIDGVDGWEEYIIVDAARKAAIKEESFDLAGQLAADKAALITRIEAEADNRDAGMPARIADTQRANGLWANRYYGVTGLRYRLAGNNLWLSPSDDVWYGAEGGSFG